MTTTGTYSFGTTFNNDRILREAWERCGKDSPLLSLVQAESLLTSMNLMFLEWVNRGINLFAVYQDQIPLTPGVSDYVVPSFVARMLQVVIEGPLGDPSSTQLAITAISRAEWAILPIKLQSAERPVEYYFERTAVPIMHFWPQPTDSNTYRAVYWALRLSQDAGMLTDTPDAANRWLDAICAGLAARAAVKYAPERLQMLQAQAAEAFGYAAGEDVEHVTFRYAPDLSCYYEI